jgi:uncharacterized integral membrane protein (TIGR00698 family)|tara:strand:- start:1026 stop:2015 length:990 start_codon:yes stop_codon:yes gene_type:complete
MVRWLQSNVSGLLAVGLVGFLSITIGGVTSYVSSPVIALLVGFLLSNAGLTGSWAQPSLQFAAGPLLKLGIALLGFRLAFSEISEIGSYVGICIVISLVLIVFLGIRKIGSLTKISNSLGLLIATGFSICGLSAIAAMKPLSGADDEEVGYALGLVTLFGSLSVVVLPLLQLIFDLGSSDFGWWVGLAVHDTGQVVATASIDSDKALDAAVLVKMARILMLAPILIGVSFLRNEKRSDQKRRYRIIPMFIIGFLAAATLRSLDVFSDQVIEAIGDIRSFFIASAMFGLGAGVRLKALSSLGGRPLVFGLVSWVLIVMFAGIGVLLNTQF